MTTTLAPAVPAPTRPSPPLDIPEPAGAPPSPARWIRPALVALLLATTAAYLWDLSVSGYANTFYAAAVQAGSKSWKAFFFGSLDTSNFITVDKTPGALWVMDLSARLFGFNTWSLLVPQALEGVAAVGILYATLKRWFGPKAGLLGGLVLATTPVAALMFRFDNPDAFLVLLLVAAAYALTRALEGARTRWMVATGALLGFAFLAKELQAFTVVPAFAAAYLLAAPGGLRRRIAQLGIGLASLLVAAGWWVAIVALWPTGSRPYIDGSPDNNIFNLIFGYNGFSRLTGSSGPGGGFSGPAGLFRLFDDLMGGQASWLLPAALVALVAGLLWTGRAPRRDRTRAALVVWGGWLVVTGAVFSFSSGIIHTYYTVALAPAIAALVGIGATLAWRQRALLATRVLASATLLATAGWSFALLARTPAYHPWLGFVVLAAGLAGAAGILAVGRLRRAGLAALGGVTLAACLGGPLAYGATTIVTAHSGGTPSAGPAVASATVPGGLAGGLGAGGAGPAGGPPGLGRRGAIGRRPPALGGSGAFPGGPPSGSSLPAGRAGRLAGGPSSGGGLGAPGGRGGSVSSALVGALKTGSDHYEWVVAMFGSQQAATIELGTGGLPVMAIGGFNGQGANISLATFESYVAAGKVHYFIASGSQQGPQRANSDAAIASWVEAHYRSMTVGGITLYDLTSPR